MELDGSAQVEEITSRPQRSRLRGGRVTDSHLQADVKSASRPKASGHKEKEMNFRSVMLLLLLVLFIQAAAANAHQRSPLAAFNPLPTESPPRFVILNAISIPLTCVLLPGNGINADKISELRGNFIFSCYPGFPIRRTPGMQPWATPELRIQPYERNREKKDPVLQIASRRGEQHTYRLLGKNIARHRHKVQNA